MDIGVPKEIKTDETRVGLSPESVREVVGHGHRAVIETGAGRSSGFEDQEYVDAGAKIVPDAAAVFDSAELIVKVKEPQRVEREMLTERHTLFTYLHLAADADQARDLIDSGSIAIAYETVTDRSGRLPLLTPMSQVAGRLSIQAGATALEAPHGGRGLLLGGVPGVARSKVVIIGGGVVGSNAIRMAVGLEADVLVLDRNTMVLEELADRYGPALRTRYSTAASLDDAVVDADLVISAVLIPGAAAPKLVTRDMVRRMRPGSVVVDVAIDQGGSTETSHATTHSDPTYIVDDVIHYCVANMPGAVPRTATFALNNATLPYVLAIADEGPLEALGNRPHLRRGLNIFRGQVTEAAVAEALGLEYVDPEQALAAA